MLFQGKLDVHIFSGYVWYAYPLNAHVVALTGNWKQFPIPFWGSQGYTPDNVITHYVGAYKENGFVLVTDEALKPVVPPGWEVIALPVPDGWGYEQEGWRIRHIHTVSDSEQTVYAIFAGLRLGREGKEKASAAHAENA